MRLGEFLRGIPHVLWLWLATAMFLGAYVYTRDEAIKNLLIGTTAAAVALSKAAQGQPTVDARGSADLTVNQEGSR